jgi:hypothetical protein
MLLDVGDLAPKLETLLALPVSLSVTSLLRRLGR